MQLGTNIVSLFTKWFTDMNIIINDNDNNNINDNDDDNINDYLRLRNDLNYKDIELQGPL